MKTTAIAHPNIALIKYWGKRNTTHNLPATGSYSLTLGAIRTRTCVEWGQEDDTLVLDGVPAQGRAKQRIHTFLEVIRADRPDLGGARVQSENDFPTAAGLASSASAFAALALAATHAAGLDYDNKALSILARRGSGSAARSIFGGFVRMHAGDRDDGLDCFAEPRYPADHWDLRVIFALTDAGPKTISSTDGMERTARTSPYFESWCQEVPSALEAMDRAVQTRDFARVAELSEASTLQMHASAIAARPGVLYWKPATVALIHAVRAMRKRGDAAFFTMDAGPHVKVFAEAHASSRIADQLRQIDGVLDVFVAHPAEGASIVAENVP